MISCLKQDASNEMSLIIENYNNFFPDVSGKQVHDEWTSIKRLIVKKSSLMLMPFKQLWARMLSMLTAQFPLILRVVVVWSVWRTKRSTEKSRFRASDGCRGPKGRGSRCEAARAAIRFGGQVREDVLKCTIAPGFGRKPRGRAGSFSPLFPPALRPLPSPTQPAQPAHPRQQEHKAPRHTRRDFTFS